MAYRSIVGLQYAAMCLRPAHIPVSRPKGAKAAGLRYERALAASIPRANHGQWFEFHDLNGPGHCQMDLLLVGKKQIVIIECKLTNVDEGRKQLEGLYVPVAQKVWPEHKVLGIVAARHLSKEQNLSLVESNLQDAVNKANVEGVFPTFHWLERTPI